MDVDYKPTIMELPASERPRERMRTLGPQALSTVELLAIILRVGVGGENVLHLAERLLSHFGSLSGLARANFEELVAIRGMGPAKTAQLLAGFELGRRLLAAAPDERPQVRCPEDVANLLMLEMSTLRQEQFRIVLLDTKNRVLAIPTVYIGNINTSIVRAAEVFREAVTRNCAALIAVHNHPSGDPAPSPEDVMVTRHLVEAGKLLDIEVLDHIIIGRGRYTSLKERGLGFD